MKAKWRESLYVWPNALHGTIVDCYNWVLRSWLLKKKKKRFKYRDFLPIYKTLVFLFLYFAEDSWQSKKTSPKKTKKVNQ